MGKTPDKNALNPFTQGPDSLISTYAAKMAEAMVVRRAALEAKAARIEADLSIRARSQFLANMNHELRTPLNAIIGFTTMLKEGALYNLDDQKRDEYADYVLQSADLLLGHINTILETADLDSGTVELHQEETNLVDLLEESTKRTQIAAAAAEVEIVLKNPDEGIVAWVDEERISQAMDHLLRIAVKASAKGAKVFARISEDENGWPEIAVRDNGKGLKPDEIKSALNAFAEDHRGLDRSFDGPGVELAVAKTFIEMQGGRFFIKSKVGKGTLIRASLPPQNTAVSSEKQDVRLAG